MATDDLPFGWMNAEPGEQGDTNWIMASQQTALGQLCWQVSIETLRQVCGDLLVRNAAYQGSDAYNFAVALDLAERILEFRE